MSSHLFNEMDKLKKLLLEVSALAEDSLHKSVISVNELNEVLARSVRDQDKKIDEMEVEVEEECLKALALYQPVASDLRYIISVLKINNDLERIGDLACNIAGRALALAQEKEVNPPIDLKEMSDVTVKMLNYALDSLIQRDLNLAQKVCEMDQKVDDMHKASYGKVTDSLKENPEQADIFIQYLSISRNLERAADYATNIAEDVIYLIEGKIVRHGT